MRVKGRMHRPEAPVNRLRKPFAQSLARREPLGSPVVPFYPFSFWVPLLKPNSRKKGTLIIKGLLGNLDPKP